MSKGEARKGVAWGFVMIALGTVSGICGAIFVDGLFVLLGVMCIALNFKQAFYKESDDEHNVLQ